MSGSMDVPSNVIPVARSTPTPSLWNRPSCANMSAMNSSRAVWLWRRSSGVNCCANAYAGASGAAVEKEREGGGSSGGGAAADERRSTDNSASEAMRIIWGRLAGGHRERDCLLSCSEGQRLQSKHLQRQL